VVRRAALGLLIAWSVGCAGAQAYDRRVGPEYEPETASWVAELHTRGQTGMWLITRGYHGGDDLVATVTNSPLSHASLVDLEAEEVIEAIGSGVVVTPLVQFLRETHRLVLVKPEGFTPSRGKLAVERARGQVGAGYDFLGVVGVPDEDRWYCSELVAWSWDMQVNRYGPQNVLHPRRMPELGEVLFDSGERDAEPD
jgi:uncharacterized protein YycO